VVDTDGIEWQPDPFTTPVANLVYSASGTSVRSVLVDGRLVMEDRRMTLLDERSYLDDAKASSRTILGRINARPRTPWPVT
jgi:5-methylthioadenosine/S-adenosylhomocysteine deaminase